MPDTFRIDAETSYLKFDPNHHTFYKKITGAIPAFAEYESEYVKTEAAKVRVFAWIVLMYDMNSPMRREIKDMYKRKVYAAGLCGISPNAVSGKYKQYVEDFLVGQDEAINNLIVKYIAYQASPEYTQLIAHMAMQQDALNKIVSMNADKNVQILFDTTTEKIRELTNLLYGTGERDEVYEARRALYKQVAYDLSDMRAENVARAVSSTGSLPEEWNPYGDGYKPDDIHFVGDDIEIAREDEESLP